MKPYGLYKVLCGIFKPFVKIIYRLEIRGAENIPKTGRAILCPNHTSNADPIILGISCERQVFFMAKKELFKNKLFGNLLSKLGAFSVDRGNHDKMAINSAEEILQKGNILGLFIEGTRSKTGEFLKPKNGAAMISFSTHTPIIPVCIRGKKQNVIRAFRKNVIIIGEPMYIENFENLKISGKEIRIFSREIMEKIKNLSESVN